MTFMEPLHILLIHQYFLEDNDGGGSRWNEMSRIWIKEGHKVTVLAGTGHYMHSGPTVYNGAIITKQTNCDRVQVLRCFVANSSGSSFLRRIWTQVSFMFSAIWGGIFYAKEKYNVVLCTSPPLFVGIAGVVLARFKRIPFVLEIRDLWPESAIETGVLRNKSLIRAAFWLERFLYKNTQAINVLTPAFRTVLMEQKNVAAEKIWLIPNAADFTISEKARQGFDRQTFRNELGLDNCFVIIYVGAHGIANHLIQLIETAEILEKSAAHFLLIGDGAEKAHLQAEAKLRKLDNVTFLDTVSKNDVFKYILAADAGASVLKKTDIFKTVYSNKTFDYFACRKPVLVAIDGVSRKLVEDADAGVFVEPENAIDFAEKILAYIENPALVAKHGSNGFTYAQAHFDRRSLAKKYLEHIQNMLKRPS
jgi:glycosyltransferase involved in cell wall biosynthesis